MNGNVLRETLKFSCAKFIQAMMNKPGDVIDLRNAEGYFFGKISEISSASFDKKAVAVPFVVVAGKVYIGSSLVACVNDYGKWLGEKTAE